MDTSQPSPECVRRNKFTRRKRLSADYSLNRSIRLVQDEGIGMSREFEGVMNEDD